MNIISALRRELLDRDVEILKLCARAACSAKGTLLGNKIAAYWWTGTTNFGDLLTPYILNSYGFTPINSPFQQAEVLSVGSILQYTPEDYSGHILGSGLIENTTRRFKKAKIWAVRGELTRQRIEASPNTVLGDPGLLTSVLSRQREETRYALGIVPHYVDKDDPRIDMLKRRYQSDILVIDVERKPPDVFADIDLCDCILSSSLHGVVVADSLGISNAWIHLSDKVIGKGFKFRDYYSAVGVDRNPITLNGYEGLSQLMSHGQKPAAALGEVKEMLDGTFQSFRDYFLGQ